MRNIEICKWYNNADSPVLFFIDDLANVWVDSNNNGRIDLGEDWGYAKREKNSSFKYLENVILRDFQNIKTTFFLPVGVRAGMIENSKIKSISKMINCDEETKKFFKSINDDSRYEIAYHGTTHGKVGKTRNDFKQEWELYNSLGESIETINKGKEIYREVFGFYPKGGKYCGYTSNKYSDESINETGFSWWCRYCNLGTNDLCETSEYNKYVFGDDKNPLTNFDIKYFGENKVIDIPSTVNGGLLMSVLNSNTKTIKGVAKIILKDYLIKKKLKEIDFLLNNKLVISIQEHISPARDDGRRQKPNIFDDKKSLNYLFNYLKSKNIWYCTGTELANYINLKLNIEIVYIERNKFIVNIKKGTQDYNESEISLYIKDVEKIKSNDNTIIKGNNNIFNIPVCNKEYEIL